MESQLSIYNYQVLSVVNKRIQRKEGREEKRGSFVSVCMQCSSMFLSSATFNRFVAVVFYVMLFKT